MGPVEIYLRRPLRLFFRKNKVRQTYHTEMFLFFFSSLFFLLLVKCVYGGFIAVCLPRAGLCLRGSFQTLLCRSVNLGSRLSKMPDIVTGSPEGRHCWAHCCLAHLVVLRTCTEPIFSKNR